MATLANIPRPIEIGGVSFPVSALTQFEWATFQAWLKEYVPRPAAPGPEDAIGRAIRDRAWPPSIASKEWVEALDHPGCFARFVQVALGKHAPRAIPDEEALALAFAVVDEGKVPDVIMACLGGDRIDPKAAKPPTPDAYPRPPEGDDPGDAYFLLAKVFTGWTHDDIMRLTFPQIRYYRSAGKPLATGARRYSSVAEARADRQKGPSDGR